MRTDVRDEGPHTLVVSWLHDLHHGSGGRDSEHEEGEELHLENVASELGIRR